MAGSRGRVPVVAAVVVLMLIRAPGVAGTTPAAEPSTAEPAATAQPRGAPGPPRITYLTFEPRDRTPVPRTNTPETTAVPPSGTGGDDDDDLPMPVWAIVLVSVLGGIMLIACLLVFLHGARVRRARDQENAMREPLHEKKKGGVDFVEPPPPHTPDAHSGKPRYHTAFADDATKSPPPPPPEQSADPMEQPPPPQQHAPVVYEEVFPDPLYQERGFTQQAPLGPPPPGEPQPQPQMPLLAPPSNGFPQPQTLFSPMVVTQAPPLPPQHEPRGPAQGAVYESPAPFEGSLRTTGPPVPADAPPAWLSPQVGVPQEMQARQADPRNSNPADGQSPPWVGPVAGGGGSVRGASQVSNPPSLTLAPRRTASSGRLVHPSANGHSSHRPSNVPFAASAYTASVASTGALAPAGPAAAPLPPTRGGGVDPLAASPSPVRVGTQMRMSPRSQYKV